MPKNAKEFHCELCNLRYFRHTDNYYTKIQDHYTNPEHLAKIKTEKLNVLIGIYNKLNESGIMNLGMSNHIQGIPLRATIRDSYGCKI
jgi:hypothetical protein